MEHIELVGSIVIGVVTVTIMPNDLLSLQLYIEGEQNKYIQFCFVHKLDIF
jgi:hypothetical protein